MLRHRRFLTAMHRLALMGALLMAAAPVVSRWMQSHGATGMPMAAMTHGAHAGMGQMQHAGHAMKMDMAMSMPMDHGGRMPMPAGHDEAACDYCVLAAGLLPFVLALLILPLLRPAVHQLLPRLPLPRLGIAWPAHAARGPPQQRVV